MSSLSRASSQATLSVEAVSGRDNPRAVSSIEGCPQISEVDLYAAGDALKSQKTCPHISELARTEVPPQNFRSSITELQSSRGVDGGGEGAAGVGVVRNGGGVGNDSDSDNSRRQEARDTDRDEDVGLTEHHGRPANVQGATLSGQTLEVRGSATEFQKFNHRISEVQPQKDSLEAAASTILSHMESSNEKQKGGRDRHAIPYPYSRLNSNPNPNS